MARAYRRSGYNGRRYTRSTSGAARRSSRGSNRRSSRTRASARTRDVRIVIETLPVSAIARPQYGDVLTKTVKKGRAKY